MITWRSRRQIIAMIIVLSPILIGGIIAIIKIVPSATCFDNKQNQDELGTDCGGSCIPCALRYPKQVTIFWTRAVTVRENMYDVAAEIENPNQLLSSMKLSYEFTLYDDRGPVAKRNGLGYIYAQERMLVIETNLSTVRKPMRAEFKVLNAEWQLKNDPKPALVAERREYTVSEQLGHRQGVVEAIVANDSPYDFSRVEIPIAVLDQEENLLGVNKIVLQHVRSGSRTSVKSVWPGELPGTPTIIRVEPRVNIFDPETILRPE